MGLHRGRPQDRQDHETESLGRRRHRHRLRHRHPGHGRRPPGLQLHPRLPDHGVVGKTLGKGLRAERPLPPPQTPTPNPISIKQREGQQWPSFLSGRAGVPARQCFVRWGGPPCPPPRFPVGADLCVRHLRAAGASPACPFPYSIGRGLGGRAGPSALALPPNYSFPSFSTRTPMRRMSLPRGFSRRSRKGMRSFMAWNLRVRGEPVGWGRV